MTLGFAIERQWLGVFYSTSGRSSAAQGVWIVPSRSYAIGLLEDKHRHSCSPCLDSNPHIAIVLGIKPSDPITLSAVILLFHASRHV